MINGLENFKKENSNLFDKNILELIISNESDEDNNNKFSNKNEYLKESNLPLKLNIPEFGENILNKSQENAIKNCFKNKLTLIRGPPGTGKTKVLSTLAYHLLKLKNKHDKIFIGAPSNRAVDNISYYLQKLKLDFIRVISLDKELSEEVDKTNSLDDLVIKEIEKDLETKSNLKKFKDLSQKRKKYGKLHKDDFNNYQEITQEYEQKILIPCQIILATINNSADRRIKDYDFPIVLLDEATQALEPDCLLPLYHKAQMVVMIGDEMQLGPTVKSENADISGLGISLFERLCFYYKGSNFISSLNEQYRMHSSLYEFSNQKFYGNKMLTHGEIKLDEDVKNKFPWPNKEIPTTLFWHCKDKEKNENYSYFNDKEIYNVYGVVKKLQSAGVKMQEIGIITPYKAQKLKLQYEKFSKFNDLKIESVDGFQGMEKDYIIISTVRSNTYGAIGFLRSQKRLNVSLTRARKGVIILGDAECLSKRNSIWRDLIEFYNKKKLIVEGDDLDNLDLMINNGRLFKEIDEEEEEYIEEEDDIEFDKSQMDQLLNVNKQTSLELIWGMSSSLAEEEEKEEEEKEEGKNEIIGLDLKNKKKKNKNKILEEKEKEQDIEDEKEEKNNKKNQNKKDDEESDSDENNKRKKKKNKKRKK